MDKGIAKAAEAIRHSKHTTAFTGAGISVESGIPPFRGPEGLWTKYDPKYLDVEFFLEHAEESWKVIKTIFYDFFGKVSPNRAHHGLARLGQEDILKAIITQNIDNLHQEAGCSNVIEFHGNYRNLICLNCGRKYEATPALLSALPPRCPA